MITALSTATAVPRTSVLRDLVALTKPRINLLVLITATGGLWLAHGELQTLRAVVALVGTALAVGAANALNCYLERDIDRRMERTRDRPLPARRLSPSVALALGFALSVLSVPLLWFGVNPLTGFLGALAIGSYALVYTPMKQTSPAALLVGAVPGALPPLMGWTAATGRIELPGLVLFGVLFLWQLPHFLAIGVFRREDYARAGFKILPVVRSERAVRWHIAVYSVALALATLALYPLRVAGVGYLAVASVLSAAFLGWALKGIHTGRAEKPWARKLFFGSLVYLTGLFLALILDAV